MRVMSYNILDGGTHPHSERMTHIPGFIKDLRSDAQALQEANGFDRDGCVNVHLHAHGRQDWSCRTRQVR